MKRLLTALLVLAVVGCGGDGKGDGDGKAGGAGDSIADRTKARIQEILDVVKSGDYSKAAPYVVFRGRDKDRNWKTVCDWANEGDRPRVEAVCRQLKKMLDGGGEIEFAEFAKEKESEGTWLIWTVKVGEEKGLVACLDLGGTIAIGDID